MWPTKSSTHRSIRDQQLMTRTSTCQKMVARDTLTFLHQCEQKHLWMFGDMKCSQVLQLETFPSCCLSSKIEKTSWTAWRNVYNNIILLEHMTEWPFIIDSDWGTMLLLFGMTTSQIGFVMWLDSLGIFLSFYFYLYDFIVRIPDFITIPLSAFLFLFCFLGVKYLGVVVIKWVYLILD
jgi:hypothetical protein